MRGKNQVPPDSGTTPRLTKAAASFADSAMMRISQPSAVSMYPATYLEMYLDALARKFGE